MIHHKSIIDNNYHKNMMYVKSNIFHIIMRYIISMMNNINMILNT